MKCKSCEMNIDPKWSHALNNNICPGCGSSIMEEHLKNLITSLSDIMKELQQYPEQLNDWLLSNYNYIKTDSPNIVQFVPKEILKDIKKEINNEDFEKKKSIIKVKTGNVEEEVVVEKIQSDAKTEGFFDRAYTEIGKKEGPKSVAERTQYFKEMAQKIKSEAAQGHISQASLASMIDEPIEDASVMALEAAITGNVVSSLPEETSGDEEEIPSAVLAMASRAKKNNNGTPNEADLQALEQMQNKAKNANKRLQSGKGGFSRT